MPLIRGGIEAAPQTLIPPTQHGVDEDSKGSSKEQIQLVEKTQRLLHGPLKHVRAAALAAALLPLASVAVSPASAQTSCPSGGAVITGFVWNDVNNNGIQDAGEP